MKRLLVLLLACVMICLTSCSVKEDNYAQDFDKLLNAITAYTEKAQHVISANILIWQEVGPQQFSWILQDIIKSQTYEDMTYDGDMRVVFGRYGAASAFSEYKECYMAIITEMVVTTDNQEGVTLTEQVKAFKNAYGEKHKAAYEALKNYYNKAIVYGEWATKPSGNLLSYSSTNNTLLNELKALKSDAAFEK